MFVVESLSQAGFPGEAQVERGLLGESLTQGRSGQRQKLTPIPHN